MGWLAAVGVALATEEPACDGPGDDASPAGISPAPEAT